MVPILSNNLISVAVEVKRKRVKVWNRKINLFSFFFKFNLHLNITRIVDIGHVFLFLISTVESVCRYISCSDFAHGTTVMGSVANPTERKIDTALLGNIDLICFRSLNIELPVYC